MWLFDGVLLRTLYRNNTDGKYPSRPSRVQLSLWDGASMSQGVREWAGETDWVNHNIYESYFKSVDLKCVNEVTVKREEVPTVAASKQLSPGLIWLASNLFFNILL